MWHVRTKQRGAAERLTVRPLLGNPLLAHPCQGEDTTSLKPGAHSSEIARGSNTHSHVRSKVSKSANGGLRGNS